MPLTIKINNQNDYVINKNELYQTKQFLMNCNLAV